MTKLSFRFENGPATGHWRSVTPTKLDEWRQGVYDEATRAGYGRLVAPVTVTVVPESRDSRGVAPAGATWPVVERILDGLVAAGVLGSLTDVLEVTMRRSSIGGCSRVTMVLADADEPF